MKLYRLTQQQGKRWSEQIALIHEKELQAGLFSKLGSYFLKLLYEEASHSPYSFLFAAIEDEEVLGFICGMQHRGNFVKHWLRRQWPKVAFSLLGLSFKPKLWRTVFRMLLNNDSKLNEALPDAELFSFAIKEKAKREGLGTTLYSALKQEFKESDAKQFKVIAALTQNEALQFYSKIGAKPIGTCKVGFLDCIVFVHSCILV